MRKKFYTGIAVLAAVLLISGASILALASPGTTTDPLITLSYLTNIFRPQVMTETQGIAQKLTQDFDEKIKELEEKLSDNPGGTAPEPGDVFAVVTLSNGQTLTCPVGTEIMLRIGTANARGSSAPALVDYTSGATLAAGSALTTNHMYLVTIEGNGITATAATVRVLVRGNYTVG